MSNENVLIVEDEVVVSEFLRTKIEDLGYQVVAEFKRGADAVDFCRENEVDIVLMDIKLEGDTDGIEAARQIKEQYDVILVYVTAYAGSDLLERAKETEPAGYLIKPIDDEELACTLEIAKYNQSLKNERKEAIRERDRRLEEKENLLDEIRELVERNSEIMSDLLEYQTLNPEDEHNIEEEGKEAIEAMADLKEKLE